MKNLGRLILPYCIQKVKDTKNVYIILNRDYKPLGFDTLAWVEYESYPIQYKLAMTKAKAKMLSWENSENLENIYLYHDGTNPLGNVKNMDMYLKKLALLSRMTIKEK